MDPRTARCKAEYEGQKFRTGDGKQEFTIKEFNSAADVLVEFSPSGLTKRTSMYNIKKGIPNPFASGCIAFETLEGEFIGNEYRTNQGYIIKIIAIKSKKEVMYKFLDQFGHTGVTTIQNIRNGQVRNPYHMNEFGGYMGVTPYSGKKYEDLYNIWHCMLVRATGGRQKYVGRGYDHNVGNYDKTAICNEWRCYAVFVEWYVNELNKLAPGYPYEIDKDLLFRYYRNYTNDFRLYSPVTCLLLPHDLNIQLANYNRNGYNKDLIRQSIIQMTEMYHAKNALSNNAYNAIVHQFYNTGDRRTYSYTEDQKMYFYDTYTNNKPKEVNRSPLPGNVNLQQK